MFNLPDLGEGLEEAEVVQWLVAEGDAVELNQPLVEVNTAKALVEIPSPFEGRIARLHAEAGAVVEVGSPFVTFGGVRGRRGRRWQRGVRGSRTGRGAGRRAGRSPGRDGDDAGGGRGGRG